MKYLQTILVAIALLLVFAFPAWAQDTTSDTAATATAAADDQYNDGGGGDLNNPKDVIQDTTSKKPLPNTGGVPLLGIAVVALAFLGVGASVLRISFRRDP